MPNFRSHPTTAILASWVGMPNFRSHLTTTAIPHNCEADGFLLRQIAIIRVLIGQLGKAGIKVVGSVRNALLLKHIGCWSGIPTARFVLPGADPKTQKSLPFHCFRRLTAP